MRSSAREREQYIDPQVINKTCKEQVRELKKCKNMHMGVHLIINCT